MSNIVAGGGCSNAFLVNREACSLGSYNGLRPVESFQLKGSVPNSGNQTIVVFFYL